MTFSDILNLIDILNLKSELDLEKKTASLNLMFFSIKNIPLKRIKAFSSETSKIEDLLSELFVRKQVMWQDFKMEKVEYCLESLTDLKSKLDDYASRFNETKKDDDKIYSSFMKSWGNACDESIKEFKTAIEYENVGKATESDSSFILRASDEIPNILKKLRERMYPTVSALIELLPEKNAIRIDATEKLSFGKEILIKYYGAKHENLKSYEIELEK